MSTVGSWPSDQISVISLVSACVFLTVVFAVFFFREWLFRRFVRRQMREATEAGFVPVMDPDGPGFFFDRPCPTRFMIEPKMSEVWSKEKCNGSSCWGEFKPLSVQYLPRNDPRSSATNNAKPTVASRMYTLFTRIFIPHVPRSLVFPVDSQAPMGVYPYAPPMPVAYDREPPSPSTGRPFSRGWRQFPEPHPQRNANVFPSPPPYPSDSPYSPQSPADPRSPNTPPGLRATSNSTTHASDDGVGEKRDKDEVRVSVLIAMPSPQSSRPNSIRSVSSVGSSTATRNAVPEVALGICNIPLPWKNAPAASSRKEEV